MNTNKEQDGDGFVWCPEHRCYHGPDGVPATERIVLGAVYRQFKLTTRQAKRYGLAIAGNILFVPRRERGEWVRVRYQWRMDGTRVMLEPPNETEQPSLN